jgi:hypothetical protein
MSLAAADREFSFPQAQGVLNQYCLACHQGESAQAGFDLTRFPTQESILKDPAKWTHALARVRDHEMPPQGVPAPTIEERDNLTAWVKATLLDAACSDGIAPGPSPIRRLNRSEYAATVRDLLNIHFNAAHELPADGAGGEGFDNAAETLFLSPMHAEKYLEAAKEALHYGASDPRSRKTFLIAEPDENTTPEQAARRILAHFLPRAFRRPAREGEVDRYLELFHKAAKRSGTFDDHILFALQGVLLSPHFLFLLEEPNPTPEPQLVNDYEVASRLSYFLWGTMPDDDLFCLAANRMLRVPAALSGEVARMLSDRRSTEFSERFVEQWLGTRELGRDIQPDRELFPEYYDAEMQSAIRYEPIVFFQTILAENQSLLNLLDSNYTILNDKLERFYGLELGRLGQLPKPAWLPPGTPRGGIVSMAAVLAVSSYPQRTSPVLRGKWVLENLLGTPPAPPPPNVPELEEVHEGKTPKTLRERLLTHRQNPVCASCHNSIDPIGFGLENYDVLGRWRAEDAGQPIDNRGELPDGTMFAGPEGLKSVLFQRKGLFIRNLTSKMLGYALGRGLTMEDACTVEQIALKVEADDYRAQTLVREIVNSIPFRYQAGTVPGAPAPDTDRPNTRPPETQLSGDRTSSKETAR